MTDTPTPPHRAESKLPIGPLVAVAIVVGVTATLLGIGHLRHTKSAAHAFVPCGTAVELSKSCARRP